MAFLFVENNLPAVDINLLAAGIIYHIMLFANIAYILFDFEIVKYAFYCK
jgi:hypothetical protein